MNCSENMDSELFSKIEDFVRLQINWRGDITPEQRLAHDFGLDGLDAYDVLVAFEKDFEVDMSNFVFDRHFGPELPFNPFLWIYWMIFERGKLSKDCTRWKFVPITIFDLYEAARKGVFPDLSERVAD